MHSSIGAPSDEFNFVENRQGIWKWICVPCCFDFVVFGVLSCFEW